MTDEQDQEIGRCIFREANDGFFIINPENLRILDVNPAGQRMTGLRKKSLQKLTLNDLVEGSTGKDLSPLIRACQSTAYYVSTDGFFLKNAEGVRLPVHVNMSRIHTEPTPLGLLVVRDVSKQKHAEEQLAEQQAHLRMVIDQLPAIVWTLDTHFTITSSLGAGLAALNLKPNQLVGVSLYDYVGTRDPNQPAIAMALRALKGETTHFDTVWQERYHETWMEPMRNAQGAIVGCIALSLDVTDRRRLDDERRKLEGRIQHAQKLESLAVLAGGIAHDFNNLLTGILSYADLAATQLPAGSLVRDSVDQIATAAWRAAELTKRMLAYSGKGKFVVQPVPLADVVEEMGNLLQVSIPKNCSIAYDFAPDLPAVEADAIQIRQVVMNLILNACEALGDRVGVVTVSTGAMHCDRLYFSETYVDDNLAEGLYVYLEVADTGCGMSEETKARIFDPFFSTKTTGRGLGLAAVLGIVRSHKGAMRVASAQGIGTTFTVLFPASALPPIAVGVPSQRSDPWRGTGTILVVDDEDAVRRSAKAMLESIGFTVITAADGAEGIRLLRASSRAIQAVLLDLTMPGLNGDETLRELRREHQEVPVILSSGYNQPNMIQEWIDHRATAFLQKPYRLAELRDTIRRAVERPG